MRSHRSVLDPASEQPGRGTVILESRSAFVSHLFGRFGDDEARLGGSRIDAAAFESMNDLVVVPRRIASKQGKLETASPRRGSVTGGRVATRFGQNRHDLGVEVDWRRFDGYGQHQ